MVNIQSRATWASYVPPDERDHASAPPAPSANPNWDPVGGVFIHYRGPAQVGGGDYPTEQDCLRDIAEVYLDHLKGDFEGISASIF